MMDISQNGLNFIGSKEGFKPDAYQDQGGVWTIGFGHVQGVYEGQVITLQQGLLLLRQDAQHAVDCVNQSAGQFDPNQNQFDALVSFAFNLGCGALSQMLAHGWDQVPTQILRWCTIKGVHNPGLLARRESELALFQS